MVTSVAVIGAGASGLTAVKCCLDDGLVPTCFERTGHIGGLWHYTEQVKDGHVTVMKNTVANASKEITAYSDFPPAPEQPIYMHNKDLENYLQAYADNFGLKKYIRLNTQVVHIYEAEDYKVKGHWNVQVKDVTNGNTELFTFDAVLICTGVFSKPVIPTFPGLNKFMGRVIHTQQYKDSTGCDDKRVLVVGMGNSAADAAVDISDVTREVFLSSRNGGWVMTRLSRSGHPLDMAFFTRFSFILLTLFPTPMNKLLMKQLNSRIDHYTYGINPKNVPARHNSTVNDLLPYKLLIGDVKMKPDIKCFTERDVEFVDGTRVNNVDIIVFGTGYLPEYPFLDPDVIGENKTHLYLGMFPPDRQMHTLATIGCFRIKGPVLPIVEMQSRLATRVFKGTITLPDQATMLESIDAHRRPYREKRLYFSQGVTQIDYFPYMDKLASIIGCKPNFWKLLFSDFAMALKYMFGPINAYQYRLMGPGSWSGAREAIFTQWDRTYYSINQGKKATPSTSGRNSFTMFLMVFVAAVIAVFVYKAFVQ